MIGGTRPPSAATKAWRDQPPARRADPPARRTRRSPSRSESWPLLACADGYDLSGDLVLAANVGVPSGHHGPAALKHVAASIGPAHRAAHPMGQASLRDLELDKRSCHRPMRDGSLRRRRTRLAARARPACGARSCHASRWFASICRRGADRWPGGLRNDGRSDFGALVTKRVGAQVRLWPSTSCVSTGPICAPTRTGE